MENYRNVLLILAVLFKCYDCQESVSIQPSPVSQTYEGDPLTLTCTYTGPNSPLTVKWYINNIATDMSIRISTCAIVGTPASDYEVFRYSFSCSNPYSLKISQTSFADNGDIWGCTVGLSSFPSPPVSQTKISINYQRVTITRDPPTAVTVGATVTLKCTYDGSATETGVKWFNGSDITGHAYTSACVNFPGLAAFYDPTRISASCNSAGNVYSLTIATNLYDKDTLWCCSYMFSGASLFVCSSPVQISFEDYQRVTITKDPSSAVTVGATVTLKCTNNGSATETSVKWFNGSDTTGHAYTPACVPFPGPAAFYDNTRVSPSCNSAGNVYSLTITTASYDKDTYWCCSYQFSGGTSPISCSSPVQISFKGVSTLVKQEETVR